MNGLISFMSLSALLLAVSGQLSSLSPSYSLEGALARSENGVQTLTAAYNVSVDITRRLQFVDESLTSGATSNNLRLSSQNDDATYLSVNGACNSVAYNPNEIFPLNTNVWDLYAAGTESPAGTYTFIQDGITYQVMIVNGIPVSFTFSAGTIVLSLTVINFYNTPPGFSTFSLPSECSRFSCNACYQNNQTHELTSLSPSYSLEGTLIRSDDGLLTLTGTISAAVDITRGLQLLDERTVTVSNNFVSNTIGLYSEDDDTSYFSVNGVCDEIAYNPDIFFPVNTNVWDLYAELESPAGTYTFVQDGLTHQVTIVNGIPESFVFSFGITVFRITVSNFNNTTPDFSTFCLPSECSQFSCNACYNSAISVSISILMLLTTLLMYLLTTL